jgi:hypothetical protein
MRSKEENMRQPLTLLALVVATSTIAQETPEEAALEAIIAAGLEAAGALKAEAASLDPAVRALLAPAVTGWITTTRDLAMQRGVAPMPSDIRATLVVFVPAEILDRVRWRVDDSIVSVQQSLFRMTYTSAVTLDDVVLFATEDDAADPALWAHEVFHVMQYSDWGIDGFVSRYLADYAAVEQEAWDFRWRWREATAGGPSE